MPGWAAEGGDPYIAAAPFDLSHDIPCDWVPNHEIALPAVLPRVFRPRSAQRHRRGRFERRHARNIPAYLDGCGAGC